MPEIRGLQYIIELIAKKKGGEDAEKALKKTGKAADETKNKFGLLGKGVDALGAKLTAVLGAAALAAFARKAVNEFAKIQRAINGIGAQMEQLGINSAIHLPKVQKHLQALALSGGALQRESIPAFQRLLGVTEDVQTALFLTKAASDIAELGFTDVAGAAFGLSNILKGKLEGPSERFQLNQLKANGELKTSAELLEEVLDKLAAAGAQINDTTTAQSKMSASFEVFSTAVGEKLAPALTFVGKALEFMGTGIRSFGPLFDLARIKALEFVSGVTLGFKNFSIRKLISGDLAGIADDVAAGFATAREAFKAQTDKAFQELKDAEVTGAGQSAKEAADARAKALDIANIAQAKKDAAQAEKDAAEAARLAENRARLEVQAESLVLQRKIALTKEGSRERMELEIQAQEQQHQEAMKLFQAAKADTEALEQAHQLAIEGIRERFRQSAQDKIQEDFELMEQQALERIELERKAAEARAEIMQAELEAEAELAQVRLDSGLLSLEQEEEILLAFLDMETQRRLATAGSAKEREKIEQIHAQKVINIQRQTNRLRLAAAEQALQGLVKIGSLAFGESKALAIAEATIQMFLGAQRALGSAPPPLNFVLAAAVIAEGLKNIKAIKKTEKVGGGFDDPANDRMAFLGGRRWARDMVQNASAGFSQAVRDIAFNERKPEDGDVETPTTAVGEGSLTVNVHGNVYGGTRGLQELGRDMRRAVRLEQGRNIR